MQTLSKHAREQCEGIFGEPKFIVDTGRNGNGNARKPEQCHDWCNVKTAWREATSENTWVTDENNNPLYQ